MKKSPNVTQRDLEAGAAGKARAAPDTVGGSRRASAKADFGCSLHQLRNLMEARGAEAIVRVSLLIIYYLSH